MLIYLLLLRFFLWKLASAYHSPYHIKYLTIVLWNCNEMSMTSHKTKIKPLYREVHKHFLVKQMKYHFKI